MELKICISPQFRAIDPPNPARGFIQQNENVRFATAACMQKYGNVSFATVACAKCMRYGGRGGGTHTMGGGGGGGQHGTRNHIYIYICVILCTIGCVSILFRKAGLEMFFLSSKIPTGSWSRARIFGVCQSLPQGSSNSRCHESLCNSILIRQEVSVTKHFRYLDLKWRNPHLFFAVWIRLI